MQLDHGSISPLGRDLAPWGQQQHKGMFNAASLAGAVVPSPLSFLNTQGEDVMIYLHAATASAGPTSPVTSAGPISSAASSMGPVSPASSLAVPLFSCCDLFCVQ